MNKVNIIGRMTKEPELRYTASNAAVLRCTVAVDRRFKKEGEQTADFVPIVAFGKTAELISKYVGKGQRVGISGRIQTGSFDGADGKKVYTTDVVAEEVDILEWKDKAEGSNSVQAPAKDGYFPIDMVDDGEVPF